MTYCVNLTKTLFTFILNSFDPFGIHPTEYLDGMKPKEEIYNQVYENIQNTLLNIL